VADGNEYGVDEAATATVARRRRPDPVALLIGLLSLGMAVAAFVGQVPDLSGLDPRWLLAGGAAVVGLMLLVGSLRGRRNGHRGSG
jgi:peptidoglycan/LPS O-acetylase OafA/YrhL